MEYGLLQDIFPDWPKGINGSIEAAGERARKDQKKKAKKCKTPALRYLDPDFKDEELGLTPASLDERDPDRPFLPVNKATEIVESPPPGATKPVITKKVPSYFGASEDDDISEGFATFTNIIGDDPGYKVTQTDTEMEVKSVLEKSSGGLLPTPSLQDVWKPLAPAGVHTAYFHEMPQPEPKASHEDLSKKIDDIFSRLDKLDAERRQSTQTEVLLFVGSGLALLLSLDILSRSR